MTKNIKSISCIIPAYNEEAGIKGVLEAVSPLIGHEILEVIVVDDGSSDKTKEIARIFPQIRLMEHSQNKGKSMSAAEGIMAAKGDYIFLLDADLKHLTTGNITNLIDPIKDGSSEVSISFRKNSWPLFPFKKIDYLSGERILKKSYLIDNINDMMKLAGYGLEVFINRIIIKHRLSIKVVQWPNVENNMSYDKRGWYAGWKAILKIWWNVFSTVSIFEMYYQNIVLTRLIVKDNKYVSMAQ